jgi:ribosomal protein L21E
VDAQEFAKAMARELAGTLKQTESPKEQANEIAEVVAQLKAAGVEDSDIQAHISTALGIDKKVTRLLDEKTKETTTKFLQHMQQKELTSSVSRVLRSYSKDDELITEAAPAIREKAMSEFLNGSAASIVTARNKFFNSGEVDEDVLDEIISRQVKRFDQAVEKRTGKKKDATPTLKPSDTTARPATEGDVSTFDIKNATALQEQVYNSHLSQLLRTPGMKREDAIEKAKAAASRVKK